MFPTETTVAVVLIKPTFREENPNGKEEVINLPDLNGKRCL